MLTYQEAYNKIIEAYFKDEIIPQNAEFCFCGTLNDHDDDYWVSHYFKKGGIHYTGQEFQLMEEALFSGLQKYGFSLDMAHVEMVAFSNYEDALFNGMCAALEVLKQIHKERGENVDDVPVFTKRTLQPA